MKDVFHQILPLVASPIRYLGGERNAIRKDPSHVRLWFGLIFPDVYEVGMSHLGLEVLYAALNRRGDIAAERVFSPWTDMEQQLRSRTMALTSLESARPLSEFDVLGFSLQYELSYTNVLNVLDLAGIPLWARERDDRFPLVIAGGPCAVNPEPMADFFDAMVIGDGEEIVIEICDRIMEGKKKGIRKNSLLQELSAIEGVYVPSLFQTEYLEDGRVARILPLKEDYHKVHRRVLPDLNPILYPTAAVVPWLKTVHDRLSVEIARGCKRGCRFCQAGYIHRPYRERKPDKVEELIEESLRETGYEEVSLLSLSSGDYGCIESLLEKIMDRYGIGNTAVSFPSMRVETLTPKILEQIKRVRKTGFTLAPEAASARLRRVINKEMEEGVLLEGVRTLYQNGWNLIKLYFMIGLPTETVEDVREIVYLANKILQQGKGGNRHPRLNVSVSTFIPKPHTPFQWEPQLTLGETIEKQNLLRRGLNKRDIQFKWHDARMSLLEGVFSRGDRRLSQVLHTAFRLGCRFDGWRECFRWDLWQEAFEATGIDMASYTRLRDFSETLPWAHIECGASEEFLKREWDRSRQEVRTPSCRNECIACGVCTPDGIGVVSWKVTDIPSFSPAGDRRTMQTPVRVQVKFEKMGPARFLGHLDMARAFHRAARRARIPLRYSQGFHPTPRISFKRALALGVESLWEEMVWEIERPVDAKDFLESLNSQLPQGLRIVHVVPLSEGKHRVRGDGERVSYLVAFPEALAESLEPRIQEFINCDQWEAPMNGEQEKIDIRPMVETLAVLPSGEGNGSSAIDIWSKEMGGKARLVTVVLLRQGSGGIRINRALGSIFSLSKDEAKQLRVLKLGETGAYVQ